MPRSCFKISQLPRAGILALGFANKTLVYRVDVAISKAKRSDASLDLLRSLDKLKTLNIVKTKITPADLQPAFDLPAGRRRRFPALPSFN